ncbi:MAG TPA: ABC transporter ATP-binding protein [Aigarchaeota archaeon]|nr:ABC transporter ATP-binding protein [Aigarchaeota archaeon]
MTIILEGKSLTKYFGGLPAVRDVDFEIGQGEIVGLIGPNGAGKTTLFNIINGVLKPDRGRVIFRGKDITGLKPHTVCKLGMARTLQVPRPFLNLSLLENVMSGAIFGNHNTIARSKAEEIAYRMLEVVGLNHKHYVIAKNLTLQERKKLELARALASNPEIILIDEYVGGLNPAEVKEAMELLQRIRKEYKVTIFWVEHVMRAVMQLADRVIVLNQGLKLAEGKPSEIAQDSRVIEAYLGGGVV